MVDLNEEVLKEHLRFPEFFDPTPQYDYPVSTTNIWRRGPYPHLDPDGNLIIAR